MTNTNSTTTQNVQKCLTEDQLSAISKGRKKFVQEILQEYTSEEEMLKSCAVQYDQAFYVVYEGSSTGTGNTHAQLRHGFMEAFRAREKLQRNSDFYETGLMW
jgi:hypothetical protein